ncbi:response regulator transcription factor [Microlunatus elymi]|uniref:Response regulator transcription factor n=1 Tax=Microlunatus elymi TaxID=2596828 RepID=A0A516Q313_9ACTN|nr:response regulator transcription factor [Microlunatus elymi]QDP97816.1 response regulator transcription factor [Microlunatus elymi]
MIRILLADDQRLVRTGFRLILESEPDLTVVAEAADGQQAIELARTTRPDVVLMDVRMPVLDGIAATAGLTGQPGGPRVLVLTTFDLDEHVYDALAAGASGFLLKDVKADQLVDAIRTVHAGDALLAPTVTRRLIGRLVAARPPRSGSTTRSELAARLTEREQEVLVLIARGLSNAEIARALVVSGATVKTHVGHVFAKLGVHARSQAVIAAYESGLVQPAEFDRT